VRANWKGHLKVGEVSCKVALYTAVSTSERISFHTINRATGNRVKRQFIDADTGKPVENDDQVKGYEVSDGDYIALEPDEVDGAVPESDKLLDVSAFVPCGAIDDVFLERPYFLAPDGREAVEAFSLIRDAMESRKVAALAETVLFRRVRNLLIRPHGKGMIATTLNYEHEVKSAEETFSDVPKTKLKGEMLELARHIIDTKAGRFDPAGFEDRYEAALADLVKAKMEGKPLTPAKRKEPGKVIDLMEALRESAGKKAPAKKRVKSAKSGKSPAAAKKKAS